MYRSAPLTVTYDEFKSAFLSCALANDEVNRLYQELNEESVTMKYGFISIMVGLMLTLMGKFVHDQVSEEYFRTRYRAFAAQQATPMAGAVFSAKVLPDKKLCGDFYKTISGVHDFRRQVFLGMRAVLYGNHQLKGAIYTAYQYLASTEMAHIDLIMTYLVGQCPEILSISCLRPHHDILADALEFIRGFPDYERPYLRILYPQDKTRVLDGKLFYFLTSAARIVASYFNPSYKHYRGGSDHTVKTLDRVITGYLKARVEAGVYPMMNSAHAIATEEERDVSLKSIKRRE